MAGTVVCDFIQAAGSSLSLNVGNTLVLTANSSGLTYIPTGNVNVNIGSTASLTLGTLVVSNTATFSNTTTHTGAATFAGGIAFPATAVAVANANTLDDYEEGTFTPNQGSGLTVVGAFSSSGIYTKIGNLVTVNFRVNGSTTIACSSAGLITTNLPFSIASTPGNAMGSCQNSNSVSTGAYGYLLEIYASTTSLPASVGIFVTITYQV